MASAKTAAGGAPAKGKPTKKKVKKNVAMGIAHI
jgi:small subunit ribosomal protein S11